MIRTISPQDMREMERAFLEGTGYPSILLMEHAAQAVVDALSAYAPAAAACCSSAETAITAATGARRPDCGCSAAARQMCGCSKARRR